MIWMISNLALLAFSPVCLLSDIVFYVLGVFISLLQILFPCALAFIAVEARFPVPTRLRYGPTVPIAKAAAEAALGYACSVPIANVAPAPLAFGARISHLAPLALSASTPIRAAAYTAYPAAVAAIPISQVTAPTMLAAPAVPSYAQSVIYAKARVPVSVYQSASPLAATAFTASIAEQAPVTATPKVTVIPSESIHVSQAYSFGYQSVDKYGNRQSRQEQSDVNNFKKGSYSYTDAHGISRRVDYIADVAGFRATVATNEPGTAPSAPAAALYNDSIHAKAAA